MLVRSLARSFREFLIGVLRMVYYWGFALVLDPGDVYTRFAPPAWPRPPAVPDPWPWLILSALIFWCAVLTYHELRTRTANDPTWDISMRKAYRYLRLRSNWARQFSNSTDCALRAPGAIEDQLRTGNLQCWGRDKSIFRAAMQPIDKEFWTGMTLDVFTLWDRFDGPAESREGSHKGTRTRFEDLHVSRGQFETLWPKAPVAVAPFLKRRMLNIEVDRVARARDEKLNA